MNMEIIFYRELPSNMNLVYRRSMEPLFVLLVSIVPGILLRAWLCTEMPTLSCSYLHQPQILINVPSNRQIIYANVLHDLFIVNNECSSEAYARIS